MHFLQNCLEPNAVMMLFVAVMSLLGYGWNGYKGRSESGFFWLVWLILGILALVSWVIIVAS
jgi:NADH:ubiquinone oxidoreductase subunit 6 (subunit J)